MNTAPNYSLAVAIARTGWSNHETARQINKAAQQAGHLGIAVDHTRVGRWIRCGEKPRPPVPELLAELLSQHFGTSVTPASLGLIRRHHVRLTLDPADHALLIQTAAAININPIDYALQVLHTALRKPEKGRPLVDG